MALPANKNPTYEDLLRLPQNLRGEILGGQLYTSPRPSPAHQKAMAKMTIQLGSHLGGVEGGDCGWLFLTEPELHLKDEIVVPDIEIPVPAVRDTAPVCP